MIGIDVVGVEEFRRQLDLGGANFVRRAFGDGESLDSGVLRLAGMWAAKEAVCKAASAPPERWSDVEIIFDDVCAPWGRIRGERCGLTISSEPDFVIALAVRLT